MGDFDVFDDLKKRKKDQLLIPDSTHGVIKFKPRTLNIRNCISVVKWSPLNK